MNPGFLFERRFLAKLGMTQFDLNCASRIVNCFVVHFPVIALFNLLIALVSILET